jgi:hypothetical protein
MPRTAAPPAACRRSATPLSLNVGDLRLRLQRHSLALLRLDAPDGTWLQPGAAAGAPLWTLLAVDAAGRRAWLTGAAAARTACRPGADGLALTWSGVRDAATGAGPFDVTLRIRPVAGHRGLAAWRVSVRNRSRGWSLWQVTCPDFRGLLPSARPAADVLFWPDGWGAQYVGTANMPRLHRRYPRGWETTMQFFGYTRAGSTFYFGVHDPALAPKDFQFSPPADTGAGGSLGITLFPENMGRAGNALECAFDTVAGVLPGDWFDAAAVYAAWARTQPWAATPPAGAPEGPRTRRDVTAWQTLQVPEKPLATWAALMLKLQRALGARLGIHFYNWHQIPFDVSYPDYFPARPGFRGLVARLNRAGLLTMPYINGRLWDINAASWTARRALRGAAKGSAQRVAPATLFPYLEEYGSGQKLAPMCPATAFWRDTVRTLCRRIVRELGCAGVYIDQVAAEKAELCFDRTHGHAPGGGGFWLAGYRTLMAEMRRELGPEPYLTTECNWEGCAADYDALLSWHRGGAEQFPLFAAVYAGVARLFGCQFSAADIENDHGAVFAGRMALLFAWGGQLGWGDLTPLLEPRHRPLLRFFRRLCELREAHAATFADGRLLRPPRVAGAEPDAPESATGRGPGDTFLALWRRPDGALTLFLLNPGCKPVEVRFRLTAAETAGCTPRGAGIQPDAGGGCRIRLPALSARVLSVRATA